ncbi:hypothetical protein HDR66_02145 [bacterium]|nr:hypothetical protein [bacterium]
MDKDTAVSSVAIIGVVAMIGCGILNKFGTGKYIVTEKGENKIAYRSMYNPYDAHVMTFDGDTIWPDGGWYPYINVGDTISGPSNVMNAETAESVCYHGLRVPIRTMTIETVNGHALSKVRKIARRDSIMKEMKTKQR